MARSLSPDVIEVEAGPPRAVPRAQSVRIVVADESPIFRDGMRRLLEADPRVLTVGDTHLGSMLLDLLVEVRPDVLLLGAASSGSFWADTLHRIAGAGLSVRTILLAGAIDLPQVTTALQSGASGVLPKDSAASCCSEHRRGWRGIAGRRRARLPRRGRRRSPPGSCAAPRARFGLTRRELDIIRAVLMATPIEIAARLSISENTSAPPDAHLQQDGVSSRVELALFAAHHRLLEGI